MVIFGSGANHVLHGLAWWLWCMAVKEGSWAFRRQLNDLSIATIEAAFQFLDLPMPCPDVSIKPKKSHLLGSSFSA